MSLAFETWSGMSYLYSSCDVNLQTQYALQNVESSLGVTNLITEEQKTFGRELRRRREDAGYTPDEFARRIGVASRTLQSVELGSQKMGEAARMKAEAVLAGRAAIPAVEIGEDSSPYVAAPDTPAGLRLVSAIVTTPGFGEKVAGVAQLLGISQREAAEVVLTQELRKKKA